MNESNFDKCQLEMTWNVFITRLSVLNVILTDDIIASPGRTINSRICTLDSLLVWWCCQPRHMISDGKHWHVIPVCSHLIKSRTNVYAEQNQMKYFAFWSLIEYFIISPRSHESDVAKMNSSRIILLKIGIKTPKVHWRNFNFNKTFSLYSSEGMNEYKFFVIRTKSSNIQRFFLG